MGDFGFTLNDLKYQTLTYANVANQPDFDHYLTSCIITFQYRNKLKERLKKKEIPCSKADIITNSKLLKILENMVQKINDEIPQNLPSCRFRRI